MTYATPQKKNSQIVTEQNCWSIQQPLLWRPQNETYNGTEQINATEN